MAKTFQAVLPEVHGYVSWQPILLGDDMREIPEM